MRTLLFCLSICVLLNACTNKSKTATETSEQKENPTISATADSYSVLVEESTIDWIGKKIGKEHEGNINISGGNFLLEGNTLTGGEFTIDMTSLVNNDLDDEVYNAKLIEHLKSEDFFEVVTYPNSKFVITGVNEIQDEDGNTHKVEGNLTIKDVTRSITFPATIHTDGSSLTASADITVNRADWNVRYGSETHFPDLVADKIIDNIIELNITLMAQK